MAPEKGGCQVNNSLLGIYYEKVIKKSITLMLAVSHGISIGYRNV